MADTLIISLKRKQFFASTDNLKKYHHDILKDLTDFHDEKAQEAKHLTKKKLRPSWLEKKGFIVGHNLLGIIIIILFSFFFL